MFHRMVKMNFRLMVKQKEFFLASLVSLLVFLISSVIDVINLRGKDKAALAAAWCYFGQTNVFAGDASSGGIQLYFMFLFPFVVSMAYASCAFDNRNEGVDKFVIQRAGIKNYYFSQALVTFLGAFLIVFFSTLLGQLVIIAAVPLHSVKINPYYPLSPDLPFRNVVFFQDLCYNYPYLYFFTYNIIGGIFGGLIGLLSYSISLHFKINRFLILTIPGMLYLGAGLILSAFGLHALCPQYLVVPPIITKGVQLKYVLILAGILFTINFMAIFIKTHFMKDEL